MNFLPRLAKPKGRNSFSRDHDDDPNDVIWWVGGTYNCWTGLARHIDLRKTDTGKYDTPRDLDWATGCVMLLRGEALRTAGMFDEQFFGNGEDLDLSLRMRQLGYVVRYVPTAKVWHREGIDYKKNVGEYVRNFTLIRNLLWVMHKHAKPHQWLTFWPIFAGYYLPRWRSGSLFEETSVPAGPWPKA